MKSLVFGDAEDEGGLPLSLLDVDDLTPFAPDWAVVRTRMTGICGSDTKQILMNFEGDPTDNAMTALISFPHVLGHEVIGEVAAVGSDVTRLQVGQRVVLNPWLSCAPRGISPVCPACEAGDLNLCWNFGEGRLAPGIHSGNSKDAPGGFAEYLPAHESMLFPVPDAVPDEVAVLADPFSVSLHAITRHPPPSGGKAVIYGAGALGTTALAIMRALYPDVDVLVVARFDAQKALAESMGATVIAPDPVESVVDEAAAWSGAVLRKPWVGLPFAHPGHIDVMYDTIGTPQTVEVGVRILKARGQLVELGVNPPDRFEWTPLYFKEIQLIGSNAFAVETVRGVRQHAIQHYLDMAADGTIDLTGMLTHTFRLAEWRDAFAAMADQGTSGAIKVAFDFR